MQGRTGSHSLDSVGAGHEYDREVWLVSHLHHTLAEQTEVEN